MIEISVVQVVSALVGAVVGVPIAIWLIKRLGW